MKPASEAFEINHWRLGRSDLENAVILAHFSAAAYLNEPQKYPGLFSLGCPALAVFWGDPSRQQSLPPGAASQFGLLAVGDNDAVLAFRGTNDPIDWALNLAASKRTAGAGEVHTGFWLAYETMEDPLNELVSQIQSGSRRLWITGHSLGGAIATLAAWRLQDRLPIAGVYTFGQPSVGTPSFAGELNFPLRRFVNEGDVVPHMPPSLMGYQHAGELTFLSRAGKLLASEPLGIMGPLLFMAGMFAETSTSSLTDGAKNTFKATEREHALTTYLAVLAQRLGRGATLAG